MVDKIICDRTVEKRGTLLIGAVSLCGVPPVVATGRLAAMKTGGRFLLGDLSWRRPACALLTVFLSTALGCVVVPVRVPTKGRDAWGKALQLDLTFLKSGSTTRDTVAKNLAAIDTGVKQNSFFWGRWDSSNWTVIVQAGFGGEIDRIWRVHNLLIQFDQNGIVKSWVVAGDKTLDEQLDLFDPSATDSALDLSSSLHANSQVPYNNESPGMSLSSDSFEYRGVSSGSPYVWTLKTPRTNLLKIVPTPGGKPDLLVATVYFVKPALARYGQKVHFAGKKLALALDPPAFLLLRRYIRQTKYDAASTASHGDEMNVSTSPNSTQ